MRKFFSLILFLILGYSAALSQIGINTDGSQPDQSAILDVKSTDKGLLLPRMTYNQRRAIQNPADGLIIFCTDCDTNGALQIYFNNSWNDLIKSSASVPPDCIVLDNYGNCYGEVTNPATGKIWLDRNLGASQVGTSIDDYLAYGSLFQWGRLADGHELINWTSPTTGVPVNDTTPTLSATDIPGHSLFITSSGTPYDWRSPKNDNLWQGGSGINNPCPSDYRIPTKGELEAEMASWSSQDATGAFSSVLKLPLAGNRDYSSGLVSDAGSAQGAVWSSQTGTIFSFDMVYTPDTSWLNENGRGWGLSVRCIKDYEPVPAPTEGTHIPSQTQIIWNWNAVTSATGYKWNTEYDYSTATDMGINTSKTETGLNCGTPYGRYVWAYNEGGNSSATILLSTTSICWSCGDSIIDTRDSKSYYTVLIGTQCWMKENLNVGSRINGINNQTENSIIEKYCYVNLESYCSEYGGLYQWNEMMQYTTTEGTKGICPDGWHLPTVAEWDTLKTELGGETAAGGKMKETTYAHWNSPNTGATNSSGFTALGSGIRNYTNGAFSNLKIYGYIWSSTPETSGDNRYLYYMHNSSANLSSVTSHMNNGVAVRCIMD